MVDFRKREDCPRSEALLDYQSGKIGGPTARTIGAHLRVCEFCNAEASFYEHYYAQDEATDPAPSEPGRIPEPLYELAEAILNRRLSPPSLARLRAEIDALAGEHGDSND